MAKAREFLDRLALRHDCSRSVLHVFPFAQSLDSRVSHGILVSALRCFLFQRLAEDILRDQITLYPQP